MAYVQRATEPEFTARTRQHVETLVRKGCYHSLELNDGTVIPGHIPIEALKARIESFPIPKSLIGKRILDVGAASGWNSFEMERRGAVVTAVDCVRFAKFDTVRRLIDSRVEYRILDVDELTADTCGLFDYTLFLGVLYHLRHPLLGLERICAITRETAFVESFVVDTNAEQSDACVLEFYETDELGGQVDNWFGPTAKCLMALCRSAGFARVQLEYIADRRAGITCHRKWEPAPAEPSALSPWICSAVNNRTGNIFFQPGKDEYISLYFRSREYLAKEDLRVEVDGYGAPVLILGNTADGEWQANLRVPPGLTAGTHGVRLRTKKSQFSNDFEIEVTADPGATNFPVPGRGAESAPAPSIIAIESSFDMTSVFHGYNSELLCCRFTTGETGLTRGDIVVEVDGTAFPAYILTRPSPSEWQVSVRLAPDLAEGEHFVRVSTVRSAFSQPRPFTFRAD